MILDDVKGHYRAQWGDPARTANFRISQQTVEVFKWDADKNPEQVNIYATVGASAQVASGYGNDHRLEFFVGLKPAQDDIAQPLAMLVVETVVNQTELGDGHSVTFLEPLWRGTDMRGFLILRPRAQMIPTLASRGLHVDFLQAIPVYQSEVAFKAKHGVEELLQRWAAAQVAFWDPTRAPLRDA